MKEPRLRKIAEIVPGSDPARRFAPARLRDARWIVGVILLALGIVGTLRVIGSFDESVTVWKARTALVPGQQVTTSDLVRTNVRLEDGASSLYLGAGKAPAGVVQRPVGAGELLARSSIGPAGQVSVRAIAVMLERGQADVVRAGTDVEVWVARKRQGSGEAGFESPTMTVPRALVSRVGARSGGVVAVADGSPVEILVPSEALAEMIDAVNSGARITLVPLVSGSAS